MSNLISFLIRFGKNNGRLEIACLFQYFSKITNFPSPPSVLVDKPKPHLAHSTHTHTHPAQHVKLKVILPLALTNALASEKKRHPRALPLLLNSS